MNKKLIFAASLLLACGYPAVQGFTAQAQTNQSQGTVTGVLTDESGEPIVGAMVENKATKAKVLTDVEGRYTIKANPGDVLSFSSVGMAPVDKKVSGRTLNVILTANENQLEEVVVTALGIKKDRKALGYSVSEMSSAEILENKSPNVVNAMAGKIPGVNVTQYSGAAGAGANITIRGGNSSAEGRENQPLFVVDGIIYDNSTTVIGNSGTDGMTRSNTTYSNRVMDINPSDIESMSVLKGAAAAALYGSRAADGVVIITTKKGAEGSVKVDFSSKFTTSWANKLPEAQTVFGRGSYSNNGVLTDQTYSSWGEAIPAGTAIYNNIDNFFENGSVWDNTISISGGSKTGSFFLSASNYNQGGIVPKTDYDKSTFRFNGEQKYGRLTVGANTSYSVATTHKTLTSGGLYDGGGNGAMTGLYSWPVTEDVSHYLTESGQKYRLFEGVWSLADDKENPYWIVNKDKIRDKTSRFTGSLSVTFDITDWWNLVFRIGTDDYTTNAYNYIAPGSVVKELYQNGRLSKSNYRYQYTTTNVMTSINKNLGDFNVGGLVGTTTESTKRYNITEWGYNFVADGTVSFANISNDNKFFTESTTRKRLVGVYGEIRADWKNTIFLSATARNDWSSTLPKDNRSYFYPSVSGSIVFTQFLQDRGLMGNDIFTFGKIRASWAKVGKDADPYATLTYTESPIKYGSFTGIGNKYTHGNPYLKPEIQKSWEIGAELKFFNGRLGLDYTYYHSKTSNQIASPRLSNANGYIMTSINSGSVINKGMEIAITGRPIVNKDFFWEITLNTSYNKGRLGEFLEGVAMFYPTDAQFGTVRAASIPDGGYFYGLTGYVWDTDENGNYLVDPSTGLYKISDSQNVILGNREPKLIGGLTNTFNWKGFELSFMFDFRIKGLVYNGTDYYMTSVGLSERTLLNNRESVTVKGVNSKTGEPYEQTYKVGETYNLGGTNYAGSAMIQKYWSNYCNNSNNFIQDVSWLKLRYISLTYDFTPLIKNKQKVIKGLSATATGSNLFTWTNYKGMDPEVSTAGGTGGSGATGIDYCSVPAISSFTFGVNITF